MSGSVTRTGTSKPTGRRCRPVLLGRCAARLKKKSTATPTPPTGKKTACLARARGVKSASRKKIPKTGEIAFFNSAQSRAVSRENTCLYDGSASGELYLDTPRAITDTAGNTVWEWDNIDPFGNNPPNENPSGLGSFENPLRFPGQYFDKETGLHQNHFRDGYNPAIGGYTQFDPIGLAAGINGFSYALSNPLSFIDPTGLDITISFNGSAAAGAGHVGIGVNSPNTVGQRPQAGQNPVAIAVGQNVPGQISPDPAPDARVVIPTTPRQDQQAQQCIDARTREQQDYNLYQNNCAQFVGQCLSAAGVPVPNTPYPRTLFNDIQHRFGGSR